MVNLLVPVLTLEKATQWTLGCSLATCTFSSLYWYIWASTANWMPIDHRILDVVKIVKKRVNVISCVFWLVYVLQWYNSYNSCNKATPVLLSRKLIYLLSWKASKHFKLFGYQVS